MPYVLVPAEPEFDEWSKEVIAGRPCVHPPTRRRSRWGGHLLVNPDRTTITILDALATAKFGDDFDKTKRAYWIDANPFHINKGNVGIMQWDIEKPKKEKVHQHIEAVAGTPEYYREYRQKNKAKRNEYMKKRYHKMRDALAQLEGEDNKREISQLDEILRDLGATEHVVESILAHDAKLAMTTLSEPHGIGEPSGTTFEPKKG